MPKVLLLLLGHHHSGHADPRLLPAGEGSGSARRPGHVAGSVTAASFGIVTPFCSCSAVPLFIGFVEAGIPLGVTFAFLISSPMVNEVALVLLWGLFGPGIALVYMAAGLAVAIVGGLVIGKLGSSDTSRTTSGRSRAKAGPPIEIHLTWADRLPDAWATRGISSGASCPTC